MTAPWQQAAVVERYLDEVRAALPFSGDQLELMARVLAHVGAPPRRILDVGTGDGVLVEFLLDRFPGAEAVALDYSKPMLDAARARLSGRPVAVVLADLSHPGWLEAVRDSRPFDAVVSGYCIHHLPDGRKRALYEEVFGLLSPGGRFLNLEHVASADPWVESLHDELFVESLAAASTDTYEEVRERYEGREDKAANLLTPVDAQCRWLSEIGFASVDVYFKWMELALFGGRRPDPEDGYARG